MRLGGTSSTAGSDRAATAAWRLFEPMQFGMSYQAKVSSAADHDLAESIAGAMCQMTDCAEMAMLWTEVRHTPVKKRSSRNRVDLCGSTLGMYV